MSKACLEPSRLGQVLTHAVLTASAACDIIRLDLQPEDLVDVSNARSDSFAEYHDFHTRLNRVVKIGVVAFQNMAIVANLPDAASTISQAIQSSGEPWGTVTLNDPPKEVEGALNDFLRNSLTSIFSAVDDFLTGMEAELTAWHDFAGSTPSTPGVENPEGDALEKFAARRGWSVHICKGDSELLRYFRTLRNCIAHRDGRATEALCNQAGSQMVRDALQAWPRRAGKTLPVLPNAKEGERVVLQGRHVILAADVCYRYASAINRHAVAELGDRGIAYVAARRAAMEPTAKSTLPRYRNVAAAIKSILIYRYRVRADTVNDAIAQLRAIDMWIPCLKAYNALMGTRHGALPKRQRISFHRRRPKE